jgi:hypothetical protein
LPSYCIDHQNFGDLVYKVPLWVHPWGGISSLSSQKSIIVISKKLKLCEGGLGFEGLHAHWRLVDIG